MRRADQLHAAFGNGARGGRFQFPPDFVDDDNFGIVVLDRFDHHLMLAIRYGHLHAAGATDCGMRHIAVPANFVRGIHDDHALVVRQHARRFPQNGRFADAGRAEQQQILSRFDQVLQNVNRAVDGAPHAARQADDFMAAVTDGGNPMQRAFHPGAVIRVKGADAIDYRIQFTARDFVFREGHFPGRVPSRWDAPQVENHFEQIIRATEFVKFTVDMRR